MNVLSKYLKKLGVKEFSELSESEKETYRQWDEVLSGRKLTDDDVEKFMNAELDAVLVKLTDPNLSPREDLFLKMKLEFLRKVVGFLKSPELEKKILEKNIEALV